MPWCDRMPGATMTSEWMKVMLEEIERKKTEAEQALLEESRRIAERIAERDSGETRVHDPAQG
jgi:hypothetical protein